VFCHISETTLSQTSVTYPDEVLYVEI